MKSIYYSPFFSCCRNMLVEKCVEILNKGQKVIYILPSREAMFDVREKFIEQYGGIADAYIFGFDNFERLFCKDIINDSSIIRENTICFIIRDILSRIDEDELYGKVKDKPGFIKAVYQSIKRLKRLDLTPDQYDEMIGTFKGILKSKCKFIASVYREYEKYKKENDIIDVDDISYMACNAVCHSNILSQVGIIAIDGFINIDPVNKRLIKNIIDCKNNMNMLASIPYKNENNEEFIENEILKDLLELGFTMAEFSETYMPVNPSIKLLSDNLYSGTKIIHERVPGVSILNSPCIEHEVRETARIIKKRLVKGEDVPDKVALYIKNMDEYRKTIADIFSEMGIPISMSKEGKLISAPISHDILSIIIYHLKGREAEGFKNIMSSKYLLPDIILEKMGYETEKILKLSTEACNNRGPEEFEDVLYNLLSEDERFGYIGDMIKEYMDDMFSFQPDSCESIYECIKAYKAIFNSLNIRNNIMMLYNKKLLDGDSFIRDLKAAQKIEEALDDMLNISSTISISPDYELGNELYRILVDLFSSIEISTRMMDLGGVKVLNPDLARGQVYDMVFLLGVNEEIFPDNSGRNPMFDIVEDDMLLDHGINNINYRWELEREKIRFNMCLGSALKEVYISYRTCDEDGGYIIKSPFVDEVTSLMDKAMDSSSEPKTVYMRDRFNLDGEAASFNEVIRNIVNTIWDKKDGSLSKIEYIDDLYGNEEIKDKINYINHGAMVEFARMENPVFDMYDGVLDHPELSQDGAGYGFSPSQLNSFVQCPFMYFSERVLGLSELEEDEPLGAKSLGTFYHEVLKDYYTENHRFHTFDEERLKKIFDERIKAMNDESLPDKLFGFVSGELYNVLFNFLQNDADNFRLYQGNTGFRMKPVLLEHPFELKGIMGDSVIKGIIDRVDLEINDDGAYTGKFIIYDYKKSVSSIKSVKDCVKGEDFQLPIYYMAIRRYLKDELKIKNPECLALIYYSIQTHDRKGIIRSDVKKNLFETRKGPRDLIGAGNMDVLIKWVDEHGAEVIKKIRRGDFSLPNDCPRENSPFGCMFKPICRFDKYRVSDKRGASI